MVNSGLLTVGKDAQETYIEAIGLKSYLLGRPCVQSSYDLQEMISIDGQDVLCDSTYKEY